MWWFCSIFVGIYGSLIAMILIGSLFSLPFFLIGSFLKNPIDALKGMLKVFCIAIVLIVIILLFGLYSGKTRFYDGHFEDLHTSIDGNQYWKPWS